MSRAHQVFAVLLVAGAVYYGYAKYAVLAALVMLGLFFCSAAVWGITQSIRESRPPKSEPADDEITRLRRMAGLEKQ